MRRLQLLLLMLLALPIGMLADDLNTLIVKTKNGAETAFFLQDKPQVTFEGTNLKVVSEKATATFALSDVLRFEYAKKDPAGINETVIDPTDVRFQDGVLVISQLKAGASVCIYALDGKTAPSTHCPSLRYLSPQPLRTANRAVSRQGR